MTGQIVVGVDGSVESHAALRWAALEARLRDTAVFAVHVLSVAWDLPDTEITAPSSAVERKASALLDDALARIGDIGARIERRLLIGDPTQRLLEEARHAQLVVLGSHGHSLLGKMKKLGSVSSHVARQAPCPVVIVRASQSAIFVTTRADSAE
jgi:nucleotide-binding universal stress UspA family protein